MKELEFRPEIWHACSMRAVDCPPLKSFWVTTSTGGKLKKLEYLQKELEFGICRFLRPSALGFCGNYHRESES